MWRTIVTEAGATPRLTHLDGEGRARMVDVSAKPATLREAHAVGFVRMAPATLAAFVAASGPKGDVRAVAELAGVMAAKRTAELIPLCHPLALSAVEVRAAAEAGRVRVDARVRTTGPTGVEMEALTAVAVACLTVHDMLKAIDRDMVIEGVQVLAKSGGRSGDVAREVG
jgi:cyclic pyranopterin phosphate synthase